MVFNEVAIARCIQKVNRQCTDKPTMEKKLAIYSRTSTDKQEKGLEAQQRALRDYCRAKDWEGYLEYSDEGISGMKSSRPEFNRMMDEVRGGRIHTVLVYSFSRFARSTKHLLTSLEEFEKLGVAFISLTENLDTKSPIGKALFTIISAIAQLERDLTAERVKNGLKNAVAKGKILGRPLGGKKGSPGRPDREILERRTRGESVIQIAKELGVTRAAVYRVFKTASSRS